MENYRSFFLLPVISKVLERCDLAGLQDHISHLISREQHGFLAGRSCVTQLTSVLHYTGGQLDSGKQMDTIYLDMRKVFDKVDHTKVTWKVAPARHYWQTSRLVPFILTGTQATGYSSESNFPRNKIVEKGKRKN